ncbi:response regulator [Ferruginibacter sp.]
MKNAHILLVEDNEGDIVLTQEVFKSSGLSNPISIARDGEEALDFLYQRNKLSGAERPDLILMDINIPKINGKEVLTMIKKDNDLKTIPVIMLSTSSDDIDILESYRNHANCFITKPINFNDFSKAVIEIKNFWFTLATVYTNNKKNS